MKKNNFDTNVVYYLRSTSIINDSRASKEITSLIDNGYKVVVLGWDRDHRIKDYKNVFINNNKIDCMFFKYSTKYGMSIKTLFGLLFYQVWIYKQLKSNKNKYNIIHSCDLDCGYVAYLISKKYNKKLVYDIYDYYADSRPMPLILSNKIKKIENKIINYADVSIICGEWRKKQIIETNPKKLIVIHNSPKIDFDRKQNYKHNDFIKLVYIGILQDNRLIMEIANAVANNKEFELHIGGFGKYSQDLITLSKTNENIVFYGSMTYSDVLKLENNCDVLFATYNPSIPNHKYSAPNKVYEAMALGKPVVVCKGTGIDIFVKKNRLGICCDYNAHKVLNDIKKYIESDKYDGEHAKTLFEKKYNWNSMERELINAYNDIK